MATCPNINDISFKELEVVHGRQVATLLYHMNGESIPTLDRASKLLSPTVNKELKIVQALSNPKTQQLYTKFYKSNPEKFYNELLQLGATKDQIQFLKDQNEQTPPTSLGDMITNLAAAYTYTIEINTAKDNWYPSSAAELNGVNLSEEELQAGAKPSDIIGSMMPTQHYSNLTVPGGTDYTENEIATPGITPSIKGHAQFSTDQGIGWFRSDDAVQEGSAGVDFREDEDNMRFIKISKGGIPTKIRRILEVQSDYGQKQRKSSEPDIHIKYDIDSIINDLKKSGKLKVIC